VKGSLLGFDNSRSTVLSDIFYFNCPMIMTAKLSGKRFLNSTSNPDFGSEPPHVGCCRSYCQFSAECNPPVPARKATAMRSEFSGDATGSSVCNGSGTIPAQTTTWYAVLIIIKVSGFGRNG
jgi:hypothetical protein